MTRQIEFKAKCRDTKKWVFGYVYYCFDIEYNSQGYDDVPPRVYHIKKHDGDISVIDDKNLGQYIGRKDSQGNKLFENDRVLYGKHNCTIKYFEEYCMFGLLKDGDTKPLGHQGSSTTYKPYVLNDYHIRKIKLINE